MNLTTAYLKKLFIIAFAAFVAADNASAQARPAILTTAGLRQIVVYSDPANAPTAQTVIPDIPSNAYPHGAAFFSGNRALVADHQNSRIFVVQTSPAALIATMNTAAAGYDGSGTIAVSPNRQIALAMGGNGSNPNNNKLFKIQAPFNASSAITSITLPGALVNAQTEGIVFDNSGRAYVRHSTGVSVLDAPYETIAFTLPISTPSQFASVAVTPDGSTLFAGGAGASSGMYIYHAPFSESSAPDVLPTVINNLDGIAVTPDGSRLLYVSIGSRVAGTFFPPFNASSVKQRFALPSGIGTFEDVGISPDGQLAILAGSTNSEPPVLIKAPFSETSVTSFIPVNGANPGRGGGAARFAPLEPPTAVARTPFDFDGDGRADLSVFRPNADPAAADFQIRRSTDEGLLGFSWGLPGDRLAPADYDGDGKTDVAVWRETEGRFYILSSSNNSVRVENFGLAGDVLTVGDYDGDGKADLSTYREGAQSYFFYRGSLNNPSGDITYVPWGTSGDKSTRGDFDGDGRLDAAIYRGSNQTWYIRRSSDNQIIYRTFGLANDKQIPGDFDGDGKTDITVFRDGVWYILQSSNDQIRYQNWGLNSDAPVPTDYDGDGRTDIAVWRNGVYYILNSGNSAFNYQYFGASGDTTVASAYVQ